MFFSGQKKLKENPNKSSKQLTLDEGCGLYKSGIESLQQALENAEPSHELTRFLFNELTEACRAGESRKIVNLLELKPGIFKQKINQQIGYSWQDQYCLTAFIVKLLCCRTTIELIDTTVIERLLEAGANVNQGALFNPWNVSAKDKLAWQNTVVATDSVSGMLYGAKDFVSSYPVLIAASSTSPCADTIVSELVKKGKIDNICLEKCTLLHLACVTGALRVVKALLKSISDHNVQDHFSITDGWGKTALRVAIAAGQEEVVKAILQEFDNIRLNVKSIKDQTSLKEFMQCYNRQFVF